MIFRCLLTKTVFYLVKQKLKLRHENSNNKKQLKIIEIKHNKSILVMF